MAKLVPIVASIRGAVEAAMRDTARPVTAIAAETGVRVTTIRTWNKRFGWRPAAATASTAFTPARWKPARRAAVARLYREDWIDIGDLAQALGVARHRAEALFAQCGLEGRRPGEVGRALGLDTDPRRMRAALRAQIARQILHFDAALNGAAGVPAFDSARVLRDLGGLKRLLDETTDDGRGERDGSASGDGGGSSGDRFADDRPADDLPALRAEIARRAEALGGERADAGPAGEPAAGPDPGPGDGLAPGGARRPASALPGPGGLDHLGGDRRARRGQDPDGGGVGPRPGAG
jgi:hypothetical protein